MHKTLNIIIALLIVILLGLLGYYVYINKESKNIDKESKSIEQKTEVVKQQPNSLSIEEEFNFKALDGKHYTLKTAEKKIKIKETNNKFVFLKIFGWDCEYCKKEIPELVKLKRDLGNTFDVIAIEAQQHTNEESVKYIKEYGINYSIIEGEKQKRFYNYLKKYYGWSGVIPLTIALGRNGNILAYEVGAKSYTLSELMKASLLRDVNNTEQ